MQLGYAINESTQQVGARVLTRIPVLVALGAVEPEICAEIDKTWRERLEVIDTFHSPSVRQAQKQDITGGQLGKRAKFESGSSTQIRMRFGDRLPCKTFGCDLDNLAVRMKQ